MRTFGRLPSETLALSQSLMDIGDVAGALWLAAEIWRRGVANIGVDPVAERQAGAARSGVGPLAHGWIDAVNTPRYARIHAFFRFRSGAPSWRLRPPRASNRKQIEFCAGRLPRNPTFGCYGKYRVKECVPRTFKVALP